MIEIKITGSVYGAPCTKGMVAPTGNQGQFVWEGRTYESFIDALRAWKNVPCTSRLGYQYPTRFIHSANKKVTVKYNNRYYSKRDSINVEDRRLIDSLLMGIVELDWLKPIRQETLLLEKIPQKAFWRIIRIFLLRIPHTTKLSTRVEGNVRLVRYTNKLLWGIMKILHIMRASNIRTPVPVLIGTEDFHLRMLCGKVILKLKELTLTLVRVKEDDLFSLSLFSIEDKLEVGRINSDNERVKKEVLDKIREII